MDNLSTKAKGSEQQYSRADLDARFKSTQWIAYVGTAAIGLLFAMSSHALFVWVNRRIAAADGPTYIQLWPQSAIWWFFPLLGALALAWEIMLQLWSIFGDRHEADLFGYWSGLGVHFRYSREPADFNVRKTLRWMALVIALPIGILTSLELPVHTTLRQDDIRDCGYAFSPCTSFLYTAARRMTVIQGFRNSNGKLSRRAGIVIDFADGRRWSSADNADFKDSVDPALTDFLQMKTHLPYNYAETQVDIPRLNIEP